MSRLHTLDVRWLEPPEPMARIVGALETMPAGDRLEVLIHREPHPLYRILERDGWRWRSEPAEHGCFRLTIERAS